MDLKTSLDTNKYVKWVKSVANPNFESNLEMRCQMNKNI